MTEKQLIATPLTLKKVKPMNLPNNPYLLLDSAERILTRFLMADYKEAETELLHQISDKLDLPKDCAKKYIKTFYYIEIEQTYKSPEYNYDIPGFNIKLMKRPVTPITELLTIWSKECKKQLRGNTKDDWK